ncbi:aminotransferase class I/II-fold pyridoxal phosphate-dependent enzyme [Pedobacter sp. N23S346]|uniref:aminotransferase class I/II-fold pyridoxal phosphate-dependent enzyme n=1 Tax=Pedobacter sp. N23S346 TaxID=3402750 RepID=UPI003AC5561D
MLKSFNRFQADLDQRKTEGTLRILKPKATGVDFYSNDYLGFARNTKLQNLLLQQIIDRPELLSGSTGSRLISGNSAEVMEIEKFIANAHQYESALLCSSGYEANLALFSTLPNRHDTIIVDEKIHRSVHDACKMSHAKKIKFNHNQPEHLEQLLKRQNGNCYVAIESLYSMDGDIAPIKEISRITEKHGAFLIVDEAHAFGILGYGLVDRYQLQRTTLATVITYGKALGAHGAAILCNELIHSYLINFASPFIYTTSAPNLQWIAIKTGYDFLKAEADSSVKLQENIKIFRKQKLSTPSAENSPIQSIIIPDYDRLKSLQQILSDEGLLTYAIYSPTVKKGTERLRICIHNFNIEKEITALTGIIKKFI